MSMLYTYLRRRKAGAYDVSLSDTAAPPSYATGDNRKVFTDEKKSPRVSEDDVNSISSSSASSFCGDLQMNGEPVAVFPQYSSREQTTLIMKEDLLNLPGSFTVYRGEQAIFEIDRQRPSMTHRTNIIDAETQAPIMAVRKNVATMPVSFSFEDASEKRLVDLQGEFFVPYSGAKSTAHLINAETGRNISLMMKGSYMNRHAVIKDESGEVLVRMISNVLDARSLVAHRRTYEIKVRAGVDLSFAVAMIVALHEREQQR